MSEKSVLFLGRFQPAPHNGHVYMVKRLMALYDTVIIGLGSAQESRTLRNFATPEERALLWENIVARIGTGDTKVSIVAIPDINDNDAYVSHVQSLTPDFNDIYSGNPLVIRLFREAGIAVHEITERYQDISNSNIREALEQGQDISSWMPEESMRFLNEQGIID